MRLVTMDTKQCARVMYMLLLCIVTATRTINAEVIVESGSEVILVCPLVGNYTFPAWTGPAGLSNPLTAGQTVNQTGFSFVNDTALRISAAETRFSGDYRCKPDIGGEGIVTLKVTSYNVTMTFENVHSNGHYQGTYGENLTATCVISGGYPEPEVYFLVPSSSASGESVLRDYSNKTTTVKTSIRTQDNTFIVNASITYTISDYRNYGNLTCVANFSDVNIFKRKIVLVDILVPPQNATVTTIQGAVYPSTPAIFRCAVMSVPATNISWQLEGADFNTSGYNYSVKPTCTVDREITCESNLIIHDVKREDLKTVTCVLTYQQMTVNRSEQLSTKFSPTNVTVSKMPLYVDIRVTPQKVTLNCSVDESRPTAKIVWKRISASRTTMLTSSYITQESDGRYNASVTLSKIDVDIDRTMDGNMIVCCAQVVGLTDVCDSTNITVHYSPQIVLPLTDVVYAYRGDNVSLTCIVDANPEPLIKWENSTEPRPQVEKETSTSGYKLVLHLTAPSDGDKYTCLAEAASRQVTIRLIEKPLTPKPIIEQYSYSNVTIYISASAPQPRMPRTFYVMYALSNGDWMQFDKPIPDTRQGWLDWVDYKIPYTLPLGSLANNTEYRFTVKSVDSYGLVSMSETVYFTTEEVRGPNDFDSYVSKDTYNKAIIISVFVTAGVFLIIIIAIVCAMRSGKCGGSSSKSYVM
ncbi:immunoglobulin superfamily member 10-like isoform X2 [Dreissena polymorpha]|uniref:immunoglobulin superfamily member 10-like isoform X2 n=1 Tax=Dreissena polymorpha TaxID=45954 RepID=UPI0022646947|nr:immunoglobulin superfamily member 10-like isoform X2 [Dreissena polymorpha]